MKKSQFKCEHYVWSQLSWCTDKHSGYKINMRWRKLGKDSFDLVKQELTHRTDI